AHGAAVLVAGRTPDHASPGRDVTAASGSCSPPRSVGPPSRRRHRPSCPLPPCRVRRSRRTGTRLTAATTLEGCHRVDDWSTRRSLALAARFLLVFRIDVLLVHFCDGPGSSGGSARCPEYQRLG